MKAREKKLQAKRGKIKTKGVNVVHLIIDADLKGIEANLVNTDHQSVVIKAALKELNSYSEKGEEPEPKIIQMQDLMYQHFASLNRNPFG